MTTFINTFFVWIFALPIMDILHLVAFLTFLFLLLRERYGALRRWRAGCGGFLILWLAAALWITLGNRVGEVWQEPVLIPLHSYYTVLTGGQRELLRSNFMNMLLFYPMGLLLASLLPSKRSAGRRGLFAALLAAVLSAGIEFCQYRYMLGLAEVDDVLHNALGALLGASVRLKPIEKSPLP